MLFEYGKRTRECLGPFYSYFSLNIFIISVSARAVIGQFSGPYFPVRPAKI